MISVIMAPADSPQVAFPEPKSSPEPELDDTDRRIVDAVREREPVHVWHLSGFLTADIGGQERCAGRNARSELWYRIQKLKERGVLHGIGRSGVTTNPAHRRSAPGRSTPRQPIVTNRPKRKTVSASATQEQPPPTKLLYPPATELVSPSPREIHLRQPVQEPKSALIVGTSAELTAAGRVLARLPRKQAKQWTGFLGGQRSWRGRLVRTPVGDVLPLVMSNRGRVLLSHPDFETLPITELRNRTIWKADQVGLAKHPAAVALGRSKRGTKERPSALKQATARANGLRPCRPGRRRGRPRNRPSVE